MRSKLLRAKPGERTFAVIFDAGDEAVDGLRQFARDANLNAAQVSAIGAFSEVVLGFFDTDSKRYRKIPIREQVEVLSLLGNVALQEGVPQVHIHVVVSKRDGTAHGGHLLKAHVRPTLEVILNESPQDLQRSLDENTGLALLSAQ